MENSNESPKKETIANSGLQIIRHPAYHTYARLSLSLFDIRVFYVRISNITIDDYTPECLTVNHIPLSPDTVLEVNGARYSIYSDGASCRLRRNRVDKKSEEATFVSTDSIRLAGSVKFEVFDGEDLVLSGFLEMSNSNGFTSESKNDVKRWTMNCESMISAGSGFLKGKQIVGSESVSPTIEVYVAGSFSGTPIILTKTLQVNARKKQIRKGMLDTIPECETTECPKDAASELDFEVDEYRNYKAGNGEEYNNLYWGRTEYMEGEDGELSWFNAGVRVGVGIGLGICLGVGIGVGLLVRTYQSTSRNFRRRLL